MKLKSLSLKNFRAYRDVKIIFDDDLNVIIGQNDIGKSTILEALDIFFGEEVVKIDINDFNINSKDSFIKIGVEFEVKDDFEIIIDTTNKTKLVDEYLLNEKGLLEVIKIYNISNNKLSKEKVFIRAKYPNCYEVPIINLKINNLKSKLEFIKDNINNYDDIDKTKSADIRKAIYNHDINSSMEFSIIEIDLQKDEGKNIWSALQKELPLYFLFQSDRENKDSDGDIQNPLKSATKQIVMQVEEQFEDIKKEIETKLEEIGRKTIEKMQDMGLPIANNLKPVVKNKNWDSLFSFTLESDDGIPLNKRGSGFRRMVLLNYFRAEAERKANEKNNKNIIYALEEPETSQHPNHQKLLIEALIKLSKQENYQILLTTHTPEIAKMVDKQQLIFIEKGEKQPHIEIDEDVKLEKIANALGIHPYYKNKVVVYVEGRHDENFLRNINKIDDLFIILNLECVDIIPMNGGNLKNWVQKNYLKDSNIIEVHIYDSDLNSGKSTNQYKESCQKVNERDDESYCFLTKKREMENYIHPKLIEEEFNISCNDILDRWDEADIPKFLISKTSKNEDAIKGILNGKLSKKMTKELFIELNAFNEIKSWFEKIKELME